MDFGLGLVLTFTDKASAGISGVAGALVNLEGAATQSQSVFGRLGNAMSSLSSLGAGLTAAVTAPISGFMGKIVNYGVQRASFVEDTKLAFTTLMGSAQEASDYMQDLMTFAKTTPFTYESLTSAAQNLIAMGIDSMQILGDKMDGFKGGILQALGDVAGATGTGAQGFAEYADIIGKVAAEGKVTGDRLDQLARRGFDIKGIFGKSAEDLKGMKADQFLEELVTNVNDKYYGMMAGLKNTWTGAKDTFVSSLKTAGLELMGAYKDAEGVTKYSFLDKMTESLNKVSVAVKNSSIILQPYMDIFSTLMTKGASALEKFTGMLSYLDESGTRQMTAFGETVSKVVSTLTLAGPVLVGVGKLGGVFFKSLDMIVGTFGTIITKFGWLGAAAGGLYLAWSKDFGGIRTLVTGFIDDVKERFNVGFSELNPDDSFVDGFVVTIMRVMSLITALRETWTGGFDAMSDTTFQQAQALGLLPLIYDLNNIKEKFIAFKDGFIKGWQDISNNVKDFIAGIAEGVKGTVFEDAFQGISDFIEGIASGDTQAWYDFGESFAHFTADALAFVVALKGIDMGLGALAKVGTIISAFSGLGKIFSSLLGIFPHITGAVTTIAATIADIGVGLQVGGATTFLGQLAEAFALAAGGAGTLHEALVVTFGAVATTVAGIASIVTGGITTIVSWVDQWNNGMSVIKAVVAAIGVALAVVGAIILGAPAAIAAGIGAIIYAVAEGVIAIHEHWDEIVNFFTNTVPQWLSGLWETITTTVSNGWNSLVSFVQGIPTYFQGLLNSVSEAISTGWSNIQTFFSNLPQTAYNAFYAIGTVIGTALGQLARTVVDFFTVTIPNAWTAFLGFLQSIPGAVAGFFQNVATAVLNFFTVTVPNAWNSFVSWASQIPSRIATWLSNVVNNITTWFNNVVTSITNFFTVTVPNAWNSFTSWLSAQWQSLLARIKAIPSQLVQVGADIVQGLWNGIKGAWNTITSGISGLAQGVIDGFKKGFDSHSPSRKTYVEGRNLAIGLAEGVRDYTGDVNAAVDFTARDVLDNLLGRTKEIKEEVSEATKDTGETVVKEFEKGALETLDTTKTNLGLAAKEASEEVMTELRDSLAEQYTSLKDKIEGSIDLFSEFKVEDFSADQLLKNMESQINGVEDWANKMNQLAVKGIDQGLLQKLGDMGPQGAKYVNAFASMSNEQLVKANQLFQKSLTLPDSAATTVLQGYAYTGLMSSKGFGDGMKEGEEEAKAKAVQVATNVLSAMKTALGVQSPSTMTKDVGHNLDQGLVIGLNEQQNTVLDKVQLIGKLIKSEFDKVDLKSSGVQMMNGLISGMESMRGEVMSVAASIAQAAADAINSALKVQSPSRVMMETGQFVDRGLALGMLREAPTVDSAAQTAVAPLNDLGDSIDPVVDFEPVVPQTTQAQQTMTPLVRESVNNVQNTSNGGSTSNNSSVTFSEGAIAISIAQATEEEAKKLAQQIMTYIDRQKDLNKLMNYQNIGLPTPELAAL